MSFDILLIMSKGYPSREEEYRNWYLEHHLADLVAIPGVAWGVLSTAGAADARWRHAALFGVTGEAQAIADEIRKRGSDGTWIMSGSADRTAGLVLAGKAIGPRKAAAKPVETAFEPTRFIVLTNPREGQDAEYNRWYDEQHLGDLLDIGGMIAAQRFALTVPAPFPPSPWKYAAIYEIAQEQREAMFTELARRRESMEVSPALAFEATYAVPYVAEAKVVAT